MAYNGAMSASPLDTSELYERLDPHGLLGRIEGLPDQVEQAWAAGRGLDLPAEYRDVDQIVVLGMGGSGIGGTLMSALAAADGGRVPVVSARGYGVPAFVGTRSLVLASSNSGNTEETISALDAAIKAGAKCAVITTGGRLLEIAREHRLPTLTFKWDGEPRSALGWSFASLLGICSRAGLLADLGDDVRDAAAAMRELREKIGRRSPEGSNLAKQIAGRMAGRLPVIVGAEALAPAAYRWRTQINENAKSWAMAEELPEMNHNAQEAFGLPQRIIPLLHAAFLRHATMHARIRARVDATIEEMRRCGVGAEIVDVPGERALVQMLWAIYLGDYVSYYLGLLNGVEPSPVLRLVALKDLLSGKS